MIDENLARLRAHRNNVHRYRTHTHTHTRLLATQLTDLERIYIERRLNEEQDAMAALSKETFPFTVPSPRPAAAVSTQEGRHV
jgi:hypothetical protein